jgi:hypothetical protein
MDLVVFQYLYGGFVTEKKMHSEAEFFFWEICFPFMTNNKNLDKRVKN